MSLNKSPTSDDLYIVTIIKSLGNLVNLTVNSIDKVERVGGINLRYSIGYLGLTNLRKYDLCWTVSLYYGYLDFTKIPWTYI